MIVVVDLLEREVSRLGEREEGQNEPRAKQTEIEVADVRTHPGTDLVGSPELDSEVENVIHDHGEGLAVGTKTDGVLHMLVSMPSVFGDSKCHTCSTEVSHVVLALNAPKRNVQRQKNAIKTR